MHKNQNRRARRRSHRLRNLKFKAANPKPRESSPQYSDSKFCFYRQFCSKYNNVDLYVNIYKNVGKKKFILNLYIFVISFKTAVYVNFYTEMLIGIIIAYLSIIEPITECVCTGKNNGTAMSKKTEFV